MGMKANSGYFSRTAGALKYKLKIQFFGIKETISKLPVNPKTLLNNGWKETTHPNAAKTGKHLEFTQNKTNLVVKFDKGDPNENGFKSKDHYHVVNPNATGNKDLYLDKNGKPTKKGSKASHIIVKSGRK